MANIMGNNGSVEIGANAVAEVSAFTLNTGVAIADDTVLGDTYKSHKTGTKNWSGSVNCYWDDTDTTGQEMMEEGDSVDLSLIPDPTVGATDFNGTATITAVTIENPLDGIVTASFTFEGNGALNRTAIV